MRWLACLFIIFPLVCGAFCQSDPQMTSTAPVSPPASCDTATDEVGNRLTDGGTHSLTSGISYCQIYTAECSGSLNTAYLQHGEALQAEATVCVYSYDSSGTSPVGETKIGCANLSSNASELASAAISGGTVVEGDDYFVCAFDSTTRAWATAKAATGSSDAWYVPGASYYNAAPDPMPSLTWSKSAGATLKAFYVTIGE